MGWLCCWKCAYQINALVVVNFLSMAKCHRPRAGSGVVRIDPLHFLAGCHKSRLNQALSVRFNDHFPGEPGLAGVYWSEGWWRWWRQMNCGSYKSCKAPVKYHHQQTNIQFFYMLDALPVAQPTMSKHWRLNQALSVLYLSQGFFWCMSCAVLVRLSVPVLMIDWKDSSPKWPMMC